MATERADTDRDSLASARVLVVGAGATGGVAAMLLAQAGAGSLGIVDEAPGRADALAERLGLLAPQTLVEPYPARIERFNAEAIALGSDFVLDCSGDAATHAVLEEACTALGIALVGAESSPSEDPGAGPRAAVATGARTALAVLELSSRPSATAREAVG